MLQAITVHHLVCGGKAFPRLQPFYPEVGCKARTIGLNVQSWTTSIALALVVPPGPISGVTS